MSVSKHCEDCGDINVQPKNKYNHDHVDVVTSGSPMEAASTCTWTACTY